MPTQLYICYTGAWGLYQWSDGSKFKVQRFKCNSTHFVTVSGELLYILECNNSKTWCSGQRCDFIRDSSLTVNGVLLMQCHQNSEAPLLDASMIFGSKMQLVSDILHMSCHRILTAVIKCLVKRGWHDSFVRLSVICQLDFRPHNELVTWWSLSHCLQTRVHQRVVYAAIAGWLWMQTSCSCFVYTDSNDSIFWGLPYLEWMWTMHSELSYRRR